MKPAYRKIFSEKQKRKMVFLFLQDLGTNIVVSWSKALTYNFGDDRFKSNEDGKQRNVVFLVEEHFSSILKI